MRCIWIVIQYTSTYNNNAHFPQWYLTLLTSLNIRNVILDNHFVLELQTTLKICITKCNKIYQRESMRLSHVYTSTLCFIFLTRWLLPVELYSAKCLHDILHNELSKFCNYATLLHLTKTSEVTSQESKAFSMSASFVFSLLRRHGSMWTLTLCRDIFKDCVLCNISTKGWIKWSIHV